MNLYTSRHYDVDNDLYKKFEKETGIKVNLIKGEADELIERIKREGTATKADLFLTADVGRLTVQKKKAFYNRCQVTFYRNKYRLISEILTICGLV